MGLVSGTLRGSITASVLNVFHSSTEPSDLHLAIVRSNEKEALRLIRSGLQFPLIENRSSNLVLAIKNLLSIELIKELIGLTDLTTIDYIDRTTSNALMVAVQVGRLDFVQLLLEKGASPNSQDEQLNTPLFLVNGCSVQHMLNITGMLLEYGADLDHLDHEKNTPLQAHVNEFFQGDIHPRFISFLVENGADETRAIRTAESTPELTAKIQNAVQEGLTNRQDQAKRALITNLPVSNLVELVLQYV